MPIATVSVSETPPATTSMDLSNRIATIKQDGISSSNASPTETIKEFTGKLESVPSKETTLTNTDVLTNEGNNNNSNSNNNNNNNNASKQNYTVMANGTTNTKNNTTTNEQNQFQNSFANYNKANEKPKVKEPTTRMIN
ncbi:unnamed protein product [Ambrosiozyma monospora]|uniref:Unnamed protein product n=1 Tax=Ambrosiozyma monospora TaxID=43982 RepID=A0A9W6Z1L5_AMBMO|nr:unnamed protein product [Ambrosiozyma monospora]